jgi:hypothetical protein
MVVVGVLLVLFVLRNCAFGGGGGKPKGASGSSTPSVSTSASSTKPAASSSTSAKPTTSASASATATAPADPKTPCAAAAIKVVAAADAAVFAAAVEPVLTLTVTNSGKTPCTRDLGPGATELRVMSGPDRIWSSDDCAAKAPANPTVLTPGETKTFKVTWKRERSKPCTGTRGAAKPGNYRVIGRVGDITSAPDTFRLA